MITSVTAAAQQVPAYCTSGHGVLTPAQWKTCWDIGWSQPTTTAANAGAFAGHNVAPFLVVVALVIAVLLLAKSRSGSPATSKG